MTKNVEVELKALTENLDEVKSKIESKYDMTRCTKTYSEQLNHYFSGDKQSLEKIIDNYGFVGFNKLALYKNELLSSSKVAVRTRWDSEQGTLLIFKYSLVDSNAENGTIRKELEFKRNSSVEELDNYLLHNGFTYQSKWSRKRTQYSFESGWSICADLNAGYQGLVEVEYVATEEEYNTKKDFLLYKARTFLNTLGLIELDSKLLDSMFQFYSANFDDFYGKDKYIWDDPRFEFTRSGEKKPILALI